MTERLYYHDSRLTTFDAKILRSKKTDRGTAICLDRTAFYPTSGGQPHDIGKINACAVLDVWEENNEVWHLLAGEPGSEKITGVIDWIRRFDHMQQHTGQHLLSAVLFDELRANTVGFHIGTEVSTIDLDIHDLTDSMLFKIEQITNQYIWDNVPVRINFIDSDEIGKYQFRKPPTKQGRIRIIQINKFDVSACGGTHVQATGELGMMKILNTESYKGGLRISFVCGNRCLQKFQHLWTIMNRSLAALSIHQDELPETIKRMSDEIKQNQREKDKLIRQLSTFEGDKIWHDSDEIDGIKKVAVAFRNRSIDDARTIVKNLRQYPKTFVLIAAILENNTHLLCTRSADLENLDAAIILKEITGRLGGKGGGSPKMAEGGVPVFAEDIIFGVLDEILGDTFPR